MEITTTIICLILTRFVFAIDDVTNRTTTTTIEPTIIEMQCDVGSTWVENFIKFQCFNDSTGNNSVRITAIGMLRFVARTLFFSQRNYQIK